MKTTVLFVICFAFAKLAYAQSYVDIARVSYGNIINTGWENSDAETTIRTAEVSVTYPIKLSESTAIVTGVDYSNQSLALFPEGEDVNLSFATLRMGLSLKHSEKWSGTYLLLPKIASENLTTENAFFFGGLALLKYQKSEQFQYRFGLYASSEAFGAIVTPILGVYYKNERWESTVNFPINGDVNYSINDGVRVGFGFQAPIRSYRLQGSDDPLVDVIPSHVQSNVIEIGPYMEHRFLDNALLLRFRTGYKSIDYRVYDDGDKLPLKIAAFEPGDDRNQFNPDTNGSFFLKIEAVYRFHLNRENKTQE